MTNQPTNSYLAIPPSGKGPGVLVLHPWWGLNDFIRGLCDRLAQEGFVALAPDLYGGGKVARTIDEAEQLKSQWDEEQEAPPKVLAALEALHSHPAVTGKGLGVIGFSMGGFWAFVAAEMKPDWVRAVTVFYATNGGWGDFTKSQAAYLGHFAETDPYEPAEGVTAMELSLKEADRPASLYTYPGTTHWFFEDDRPDAYDEHAAKLAWERTVAFFRQALAEEPV